MRMSPAHPDGGETLLRKQGAVSARALPRLSLDVVFIIFEILGLPPVKLAPYRRCCRGMVDMVARLVRRFDASQLRRSRLSNDDAVGCALARGITVSYPHLEVGSGEGLTQLSRGALKKMRSQHNQ